MVAELTATRPHPVEDAPVENEPLVWRVRTAVVCLLLVALCFNQDAGRVVPDTKLDLTTDPWGFLGRALHMWDPRGFGGEVQNQATGYLFPVGPFFGVGQAAGLPPWVVQRLWWSVLVIVAFLGVVRLAGALGIGRPWARLLAGLAFALSPRMLSSLGPISVEVLPMCLAPWAVVPLVHAGRTTSCRRAAALSGLAIVCMGGVNAAAVVGGVLPAALWCITGPPAGVRLRLTAWWALAAALATSWWAVPLVLLGRYGADFLPYTETAGGTTSLTSPAEVLRGTSNWVTFLIGPDGPLRPAAWDLLTQRGLVFASVAVVAAGLAGLALRTIPGRRWLVTSLLVGLLLLTAGHVGPLDSPIGGSVREALDGVLAPLRNVHKFDPLVRLPLVLGLCHAASSARWSRDEAFTPGLRRLVGGLLAIAVVLTALPALAGRVPAGASWSALPAHWQQVARYLREAHPAGRALVLPGAQFGQYTWGDPMDEPLQPLSRTPWEVRDVNPLVPNGHVRFLDAVDEQLRAGRGSTALAALLARSGISHLVVRNDLKPAAGAARPDLLHQALAGSFGLRFERGFGRQPADQAHHQPARSAVEVYAVDVAAPVVHAARLADSTLMTGGPESLLPALEQQLVGQAPTVLAAQLPAGVRPGRTLLTDGLRRREVEFTSARHTRSATLALTDPLRFDRPTRDYLVGRPADETVAELEGATAVRASSSLSDPDAGPAWSAAAQPYAAFDGDPATEWVSAPQTEGAVGQWLELTLAQPVQDSALRVTWGSSRAAVVRRLRVDTDAGSVTRLVSGTGTERVALPHGSWRRVRLTVAAVDGGLDPQRVAIAEVQAPHLRVYRPLAMPALPVAAGPDAVSILAPRDRRGACVTDQDRTVCAPDEAAAGEEDSGLHRLFDVGPGGAYAARVTVVPRPGPALDALLARITRPAVRVLTSSVDVDTPLAVGSAALDGDPGTGWIARGDDPGPSLVLGWLKPLRIRSLRLVVDKSLPATRPTRVTVRTWTSAYETTVGKDGLVTFPPVTTSLLALDLRAKSIEIGTTRRGTLTQLGIGVSEVVVPGLAGQLAVVPDTTPVRLPCGTGPSVFLPGRQVRTGGTVWAGDLRRVRPMLLHSCDDGPPPRLAGQQRLLALPNGLFNVDAVALRRVAAPAPSDHPLAVRVTRWDSEHRSVDVAGRDGPALLVVAENVNAGWRATAGGRALRPVTVDGWQQAWLLPAGPRERVALEFAPGRTYRGAMAAGGLAVLLLLLGALWRSRPPVRPAPRAGRHAGARVAAAALAAPVALLLLAGVGGLALWVLVALALRTVVRRAWALAAVATLAAGVLMAARPWAHAGYLGGSWLVTLLALVGVAAVCAAPPAPAGADASPAAPGTGSSAPPPAMPPPQ